MSLSRRDVLQAFLGLPAALAACHRAGSSGQPNIPDGGFVSRSHRIGHRIRDGVSIQPPADRWQDAQVVVIGGGVAGLSAARRLVRGGVRDVLVLELEKKLGGTSQSGRSDIGAYPWGAHYITAPMPHNRVLTRLLREMSIFDGEDERGDPVVAEQFLCRDPSERVFYYGRWYEGLYLYAGANAEDRAQYTAFDDEIGRLSSLRDGRGRRAFALPMSYGSDDAAFTALDRMSMAEWMDAKGFSSPRLRWYVEYACRDDYGCVLEDTSAWAGLQYFASRVRESGSDYQPVITWPEGNGRLIDHLAAGLEDRVRTDWAVTDVRPVEGTSESATHGSRVEIVGLVDDGRDAVGIRAQHVVFAAPQFLARYLIRDYRERPPAHLSSFSYGPWMVANLTLRERPGGLGFPLSWDNVIYESPALGYVVSTHQRGLDHGRTVVSYYYPLLESDPRQGRQRLLNASYAEWADVVLTDLERPHRDIRAITERIDIRRWGHAMIRPTPGFVWGGARAAAARPYRNIHFAHSDLSGVALFEEALDRGTRAAEQVLTARGIDHETWR